MIIDTEYVGPTCCAYADDEGHQLCAKPTVYVVLWVDGPDGYCAMAFCEEDTNLKLLHGDVHTVVPWSQWDTDDPAETVRSFP